jgi:tRNA-specific 2-thiouridylase
MSGGVDSSVAALLLKERGFDVVGLFMRNWRETDENGCCTAEEDFSDVRAVSESIGIPYYTTDFSSEYWNNVFKLFVEEYAKGRTPNPDVLCNREIKFGSFKRFARELGADFIATGHYAQTKTCGGINYLLRAVDEGKDQTYFLNQLSNSQLDGVIFPIGGMTKPEVREYAVCRGIPTARKKDSTGVCFIGERDFRRFLQGYIPMKEGDMVNIANGKTVGRHNGVFYYTDGQRHGLGLGGAGNGEPWFVAKRDVEKNILYVAQGEPPVLFSSFLETEPFNFISGVPLAADNGTSFDFVSMSEISSDRSITFACDARIRHRQPLQRALVTLLNNGGVRVEFSAPQRAAASGQYCVLYSGDVCLGGGVIK